MKTPNDKTNKTASSLLSSSFAGHKLDRYHDYLLERINNLRELNSSLNLHILNSMAINEKSGQMKNPMNENTEKFFKLIGWNKKIPANPDGWWHQPDGQCYGVFLPEIETDYNAFFNYVIPEMFKKGFGFKTEYNPFNFPPSRTFKVMFWKENYIDTRRGCIQYEEDFLVASVKSAINCLESLKDGKSKQ